MICGTAASAPGSTAPLGGFPVETAASEPVVPLLTPRRLELGLVPFVGGSSDVGVALGALGSLVQTDPFRRPYRFAFDLYALVSFRTGATGALEVPFQGYHLQLIVPDLGGGRVRLRFKIAFQQFSTMPYYGLGNASVIDPVIYATERGNYRYDWLSPSVLAELRVSLADALFLRLTGSYQHNWIRTEPTSKLAADAASADPAISSRVRGLGSYGAPQLISALVYDNRDREAAPTAGGIYELSLRLSPGPLFGSPFLYGAALVSFRQYAKLYRDYLVLAVRALSELMFGDPPFYDLGQYDNGSIGGGTALRGVPLLRYYGKIKALVNLELRSWFWRFAIASQRFALGAVVFFDAGRVWTDYTPLPAFDGTGVGIKYGVGGGLRLLWGENFVLRADIAWSPDAMPVGFYFNAGHAF